MTDLIDSEALGIGKANPNVFEKPEYADGWNSAIDILQKAPKVDAVEVVRCRDCEYFKLFSDGYIKCKHKYGLAQIDSDSFCSRGERKYNG